MSYEYRGPHGVISLHQDGRGWEVRSGKARAGHWRSPDAAIEALHGRASGIRALDRLADVAVPDDLLRWTPLGEHL